MHRQKHHPADITLVYEGDRYHRVASGTAAAAAGTGVVVAAARRRPLLGCSFWRGAQGVDVLLHNMSRRTPA